MLTIKLFQLVFCLFRFNRNIGSLQYRTKTTETNSYKTNPNKPKQPKILWKNTKIFSPSYCFGCFCLFRFNRNTETLCFGIEPKQPIQTFVSDSAETSFGSWFRLFQIETSFEGHPMRKLVISYYIIMINRHSFQFDNLSSTSGTKKDWERETTCLREGGTASLVGNHTMATKPGTLKSCNTLCFFIKTIFRFLN